MGDSICHWINHGNYVVATDLAYGLIAQLGAHVS
jgi:hypothetical protein